MKSSIYFGTCFLFVYIFGSCHTTTPAATLINFLVQSSIQNPSINGTSPCFAKYLPILNAISSNFSTNYEACTTLSVQQIATLYNESTYNRSQLIQESEAICSSFQNCRNISDELSFFECYENVSSLSIAKLYNVYGNATLAVVALNNSLQNIQNQREHCKNETEQIYIGNTAETYELLTNCLHASASPSQSILNFNQKTNSECQTENPVESNSNHTRVHCQCGNANSIRLELLEGDVEILNQTGCQCEVYNNKYNNDPSDYLILHFQCNDEVDLRINISGVALSVQTQSGIGCQSTILGNSNGNSNQTQCSGNECQTMPTMGTIMPTMPPMETLPPMGTIIPTMPPMETLPPMGTIMPTMPPMETLPPMGTIMPTMPPMGSLPTMERFLKKERTLKKDSLP